MSGVISDQPWTINDNNVSSRFKFLIKFFLIRWMNVNIELLDFVSLYIVHCTLYIYILCFGLLVVFYFLCFIFSFYLSIFFTGIQCFKHLSGLLKKIEKQESFNEFDFVMETISNLKTDHQSFFPTGSNEPFSNWKCMNHTQMVPECGWVYSVG